MQMRLQPPLHPRQIRKFFINIAIQNICLLYFYYSTHICSGQISQLFKVFSIYPGPSQAVHNVPLSLRRKTVHLRQGPKLPPNGARRA